MNVVKPEISGQYPRAVRGDPSAASHEVKDCVAEIQGHLIRLHGVAVEPATERNFLAIHAG